MSLAAQSNDARSARAGQVVLDLGQAPASTSCCRPGASPGGHAYGVDMTDEMLAIANANRDRAGVANATFIKGSIESIPLPDASVDVVISNCVINLAEDKGAVIEEASACYGRRALRRRRHGRARAARPSHQVAARCLGGCLSGTIPIDQYRAALLKAASRIRTSTCTPPSRCPRRGQARQRLYPASKPGTPSAPDRAASKLPAHETADHHQRP